MIKRLLALSLFAAAPSYAQTTWLVDDDGGPGVDFTEIQAALEVAGPLDLVNVRAGDYGGFTMRSGQRVVGQFGVNVWGYINLTDIPNGSWAVVADLQGTVQMINCEGTVLLSNLRSIFPQTRITDCADVRIRDCNLRPAGPPNSVTTQRPPVIVHSSRVQIDDTEILAKRGIWRGNGGVGLVVNGGSYIHVSNSRIRGGNGGGGPAGSEADRPGSGGHAVFLDESSGGRFVGSVLHGGRGGFSWGGPTAFDGFHGSGLRQCGGTSASWNTDFVQTDLPPQNSNPPAPGRLLECGATHVDSEPIPSLRFLDPTPTTGGSTALRVEAAAGSSLRLIAGRAPEVDSSLGTPTPRLVQLGRNAHLGTTSQAGLLELTLEIPSSWPRGTVMHLQAARTGPQGHQDFTNSCLLLVR